jgi:cobalt-zinc-cadmium efflux system membrane fusion protein
VKNKKLIIVAVTVIALIAVIMMFKEKKIPAEIEAPVTATAQDRLCIKHQLPIATCFFCDPALREPGRLWCKEHERYEDRCFICHPDAKEADRLWCEEHKLYEDECFFCHPELGKAQSKSKGKEAAISTETQVKTLSSNELQCLEHRVLEKECGICQPELITTLQPGQGLKIRLESPESAVKSGVLTAIPTAGNSLAGLVVFSRVSYDQNRLANITPLTAGVVQNVLVDVGVSVSKGQVLVEISSPDIARAKADYLSALANEALTELVFKREKGLVEKKISSQQEYDHALAEYQMAGNTTTMTRQQLLNYGLTEEQIREFSETHSSSSLLPILAPFSGTLIDRNAVVGESVKPGDMLFTMADLSSMWLDLSVTEDRLFPLEVGDPVEATFDVLPGVSVCGRLIWLASGIDEQSRMMKARAIVPNPDLLLKHGMFGQVRILPKQNFKRLQVPVDALHRFDGIPFIFIKLTKDLYEIRRVTLGGRDTKHVEILEGVLPEEEVVVVHSFTLKSEFLKSRLGAGCVDE